MEEHGQTRLVHLGAVVMVVVSRGATVLGGPRALPSSVPPHVDPAARVAAAEEHIEELLCCHVA